MFARSRWYWLSTAGVAYASIAALSAGPEAARAPALASTFLGRFLPWLALIGLPTALALLWNATEPPARGEDRIEGGARSAARAVFAGSAVLLAAQTGPSSSGFVALANAGAAVASMGALVGLARIGSLGGLVETPLAARRLEAAAFASLLWTVAIALPGARAVGLQRAEALDPLIVDWSTVAASIGALGLLTVMSFRVLATRHLELGVGERARVGLFVSGGSLAVGVLASAVGVSSPDRALPLATIVACVATAIATVIADPTILARSLRILVGAAGVATPVALGAVYVTVDAPRRAGAVVLAACAASAIGGLLAPMIARRLAATPAGWLGAIERAFEASTRPDPDGSLEAALGALGEGACLLRTSGEKLTVDRAGYRHVEAVELPTELIAIADREPERVLRTAAAHGVEVRRPELRPIAIWLDAAGIAAVVVVRDEVAPTGLIALPRRSARPDGPSLEEVRALCGLADRLGAVIAVDAALARSRARELVGREEITTLGEDLAKLRAARDRDAAQMIALARMLERPARAASYSPAARATVEQLERLAAAGKPIALLTPPGVDAIAWSALAHLASPRKTGPLAIVDGTSPGMHELATWRDAESSPLAAAAGGTLVVTDAHALPLDVQSYLGAALPETVGITVSLPSTVDALTAAGKLSERLADRLGDRAVALPTLAVRSEDLRALALEHLGRISVRLGREPLGLAPRSLAALLEHTWPANDAELYATLLKAALIAEGSVVTPKDLTSSGFDRRG